MKNSLIISAFFVCGLLLGVSDVLPSELPIDDFSSYSLYALMLLVGIGIGADKSSLKVLISMRFKIAFVPFATIVGTLAGVAVVSLFLPEIDLRNSLAVGAGFGYYSLSSIFIAKLSGETFGTIALLSNVLREITTLLATPFFVRFFGKLAPIASGGATSMDTTLPVITKYSGKEYAVISVFNGVVLTIIVPILVTFILS